MLFNSFGFWLFFVVVLVLYQQLRHRGQNVLLLIASYFFYGCWDWRFLGLILFSTLVDYCVALAIERTHLLSRKRLLLFVSMAVNLGLLAFFKYYGFFAKELAALLQSVGAPAMIPTLSIILPVGISFYTFQTMSYTIDVYRGDCKATDQLLDFAVYVAFFPQLVAGPIERASHFLPQVLADRRPTAIDFRDGLYLVISGMFRKVVIADNMAPLANTIFARDAVELSGWEVMLGVYAFAFQIYGDFSGYSAIARGVSKWLGFDLMANFHMPYFAISPSDFWRRWHISLSQWLRDYLYIPLGGNRGGTFATYRNLMLTMLLGGLWHGANWTFIVWGAIHGLLLCGYRALGDGRTKVSQRPSFVGRLPQMILMFHFVCFAWLFFRAESLTQALAMLGQLGTWGPMSALAQTILGLIIFFCVPLLLLEWWFDEHHDPMWITQIHWGWRTAVYAYLMLMMVFFPPPAPAEFIYFQF
ncbi:MAG: MBOAT family protein [Planctomycetaceae bacterium]|nr:MBOAT family protein [Planctomycetaceae bacterium]